MTTHQRNFPSIDPAKLDRLAELAVKVGLGLQPGQDLFLTAPSRRCRWCAGSPSTPIGPARGLVTPILSDEEITLARYRFGRTRASTAPPAGFTKASPRPSPPTPPGSPSSATIRCCSSGARSGQGRARQPGQFDRLPAGAGEDRQLRHQLEHRRLSDAVLGEAVFPGDDEESRRRPSLADAIFAASRVDNADPVAAWDGAQRRAGQPHRLAERHSASRRCIFGAGNRSDDRPRRRPRMAGRRLDGARTASSATRTSPPRRSSPRRMRAASRAASPAPSRSPTRAR